ncbi:MAG: PSD1 and planctomycete cytochrome C domain-containing protein [Pirellulales bacterium]
MLCGLRPLCWLLTGLVALLATQPVALRAEDGPSGSQAAIDYNRQIRPILSNNCFKCHGPDEAERQAGLRLDQQETALAETDSGALAIVPGKPEESELVQRIFADDAAMRMPPPDSNKQLKPDEKELLKQWIAQGAPWKEHWSFVPPKRPPLPAVDQADWPQAGIDYFILARLEAEGLSPSAEADRPTLIRRLAFDLTGLPPAPAEVDAFLADGAPGAYERLVERFLNSPRYGERMAVEWLDAARFADTHGYHIDSGRDMTLWREWVIESFNRNLPFDQFTIEQLAGDLLPGATLEQQIASGFNRNHMINFEGGAIPEEYHAAYIVDRINTTGTVWLGLSIACSQCHDHKYDPITQKEYYQLYAFFHNVPEKGLDGAKGNAAPVIKVPSLAQKQAAAELAAAITETERQMAEAGERADAAQVEWENTERSESGAEWSLVDAERVESAGGATFSKLDDKSFLAAGANPPTDVYTIRAPLEPNGVTALRLEALDHDGLSARGPGRSANGNVVLTEVKLALEPAVKPEAGGQEAAEPLAIKIKAAAADFSQKDFDVARAADGNPDTGWAIHPETGKPHAAVFEFEQPIGAAGPGLLVVTLEFKSRFAQHQLGRFRLAVTTAADPHGGQELPAAIQQILAVAPETRSDQQREELKKYYREKVSPELGELAARLERLRKEQEELDKQIPSAMVMREMDAPRETYLLVRGEYDKRGEQVQPGVPAALPPLPAGAPVNRLGLARWLVDPSQPLTARVTVNRYWQMFFGTGLVKTSEDFGSQGDLPSHPQLLDWLAAEFLQSGWDVKHLVRLIVTSAAYRQSSAVTPDLLARDPENRLLARGARFRLQAEFIRDQALAVSGLLDDRLGGPSVSPYQPEGLWEELASREDGANWTAQTYRLSAGPDLYRRTMYTFWKRTSPPPTLVTFDAPDRETCTVRRARTNTPLQALILLNDPTYVEASRKLAERMMTEAGAEPAERIAFAFRLATARQPSQVEADVLSRIFDEQLAVYRGNAEMAAKLLDVGQSPRNEQLEPAELAAWTTVASVILNLDEVVTKN